MEEMNGAAATTKAWKLNFTTYIQLSMLWAHRGQSLTVGAQTQCCVTLKATIKLFTKTTDGLYYREKEKRRVWDVVKNRAEINRQKEIRYDDENREEKHNKK